MSDAPWAIHEEWMKTYNLHNNNAFLESYFIQYRDWLDNFINTHYPTVLDVHERVNFAILFDLFQLYDIDGDDNWQHIRVNILLRGLLPLSENMPDKLFLTHMLQQYPEIPEGTLLYFFQLYHKSPQELPRKVTDGAFRLILRQLPTTTLRSFAETTFMGQSAYQLIPQTLTETDVQAGTFELPVPGYDLMHYATLGDENHYYGIHLQSASG